MRIHIADTQLVWDCGVVVKELILLLFKEPILKSQALGGVT